MNETKSIPSYCQVLKFKDSNGQIKEMIFPKALDLDRPKRPRTTFSEAQLASLENEFQRNPYLIGKDRTRLAEELGLTETQIKVWFQNRRTKSKRTKSDGDQTQSSPSPPCANDPACDMNVKNQTPSPMQTHVHSLNMSQLAQKHHSDGVKKSATQDDARANFLSDSKVNASLHKTLQHPTFLQASPNQTYGLYPSATDATPQPYQTLLPVEPLQRPNFQQHFVQVQPSGMQQTAWPGLWYPWSMMANFSNASPTK